MAERADFDKIELYLVRVLHTLITERSVSRAAHAAAEHATGRQRAAEAAARADRRPAAGARRPRHGAHRHRAARCWSRPRDLLREAEPPVRPARARAGFDPRPATPPSASPPATSSIRCSCPSWWRRIKQLAPQAQSRAAAADRPSSTTGAAWRSGRGRPGDRQLAGAAGRAAPGPACSATRSSAWSPTDHPAGAPAPRAAGRAERYLACEHVAPMPLHAGRARRHRRAPGRARACSATSWCAAPHFGADPADGGASLLVLTTGRLFCSRYVETLPVRIVRCPVPFPAADLLPALARPDARIGAGALAARAGARGGAARWPRNDLPRRPE